MSSIKIALPVSILTISTPCRCVVAFSILAYYLVNSCLGFFILVYSIPRYLHFPYLHFQSPQSQVTHHQTETHCQCTSYCLLLVVCTWTCLDCHPQVSLDDRLNRITIILLFIVFRPVSCCMAIVLGQWPVTSETFSLRKVSFEYRDAPAPAYFQFLFIVLLACMLLFQNPFVRYM